MPLYSRLFTILLFLALAATCARAQAPRDLTLAVSEGTSGGLDHGRVLAKYGGLAEVLGRVLKRKVNVVFAREFSTLDEGMRTARFDFVFARPSDYPARGMRDNGYRFVATAVPDGQCLVVVPKESPLQSLAEAKGRRWVLPEQVSYMSRFCTAELRDRGILVANENVKYVREQAAVTFFLENKFADVGAVASYSGPGKTLEKSGHRVLHASVKQPYFPLVAGPRITPEQVRAIQAELSSLGASDAGKDVLKTIGVAGFDTQTEARLRALLGWLGV